MIDLELPGWIDQLARAATARGYRVVAIDLSGRPSITVEHGDVRIRIEALELDAELLERVLSAWA